MSKLEKGKLGEEIACRYVERLGFEVIKRNFHVKFSEIDLLCFDLFMNCYVVCEVRSKSDLELKIERDFPRRKMNRLRGLCSYVENLYDKECRVDLVYVQFVGKKYYLKYFKDVLG